jgi:hypothetical protein
MIKPKKFLANSFLRASYRIVSITGLAIALSACGLMGVNPESQVRSYQYRPQYGFVRIEHIEPGAPDNAHPFTVSVDALRQTLASLKVKGTTSRDAVSVFTGEELEEIVPHLVAALAKAGPKEDVTFAVLGEHGAFGRYSPKTVTTGRVFTHAARLNVIFGRVHEPHERGAATPLFTPGSRARRIESIWSIEPGSARLADNRSDWLMFDVTTLPAQKEKTDGGAATPVDSRYQDIKNRLGALDRLKADGLITEEEYRERRRAILRGI